MNSVCVDIHTRGLSLRKDKAHFSLIAGLECRTFVSKGIRIDLRRHSEDAVAFLSLPMHLKEKKDVGVHSEGAGGAILIISHPGIQDVLLSLMHAAGCFVTFARLAIARGLSMDLVGKIVIGVRAGSAAAVMIVCDVKIYD